MRKFFILMLMLCSSILSFGNAFAGLLDERVTTLETTVAAQQSAIANLQVAVADLLARLSTVENNPSVQMGTLGHIRLDTNEINGLSGPHAIFEGVNVHVNNGSGMTRGGGTGDGLGNLIIGYNEVPGSGYGTLQPGDRRGSHNLVIGVENKFLATANSGIVQGEGNTIGNYNAAAIGGDGNIVTGDSASAFGGSHNTASAPSSVSVGGTENAAAAQYSATLGGKNNTASGYVGSVTGGQNNNAAGGYSSVSGGTSRQALDDHDWAAGSLWENY